MHALTSETKEQSAGEQAGERFWPIPVCASSLGTGSTDLKTGQPVLCGDCFPR